MSSSKGGWGKWSGRNPAARQNMTKEDEEAIIRFYAENPMLWKHSHPQYKLLKEKPLLLQRLCDQLGPGRFDVNQIKSKWKTLRDNFHSERRKEQFGRVKGYRSHWHHYNRLRFLGSCASSARDGWRWSEVEGGEGVGGVWGEGAVGEELMICVSHSNSSSAECESGGASIVPKTEMTSDNDEDDDDNKMAISDLVGVTNLLGVSNVMTDRSSSSHGAVLTINVGGTFFTTNRSTLCKYDGSMLTAMFSGRHAVNTDPSGYPFIDIDPIYFEYILNFLRSETVPPTLSHPSRPPSSRLLGGFSDPLPNRAVSDGYSVVEMYRQASYLGLTALTDRLLVTSATVADHVFRERFLQNFEDFEQLKRTIIETAMKKSLSTPGGRREGAYYKGSVNIGTGTPSNPDCRPRCTVDVVVGPGDGSPLGNDLRYFILADLQKDGFRVEQATFCGTCNIVSWTFQFKLGDNSSA